MSDIFSRIESEFRNKRVNAEIVELLKENHWKENPLPMNNRYQRIAHALYVERKSLEEVAASEGVLPQRIEQLNKQALEPLQRLAQARRLNREMELRNDVPEYDYDVRQVMVNPDGDVDRVKRLLATDLGALPRQLSVRCYNALRGGKLYTLNDLVITPPSKILIFRNMGAGGFKELEGLLDYLGLKWRNYYQRPNIPLRFVRLPPEYPIKNFVWPLTVLSIFKKERIKTMEDLLNNTKILHHKDLNEKDRKFIETRLKEWIPK